MMSEVVVVVVVDFLLLLVRVLSSPIIIMFAAIFEALEASWFVAPIPANGMHATFCTPKTSTNC